MPPRRELWGLLGAPRRPLRRLLLLQALRGRLLLLVLLLLPRLLLGTRLRLLLLLFFPRSWTRWVRGVLLQGGSWGWLLLLRLELRCLLGAPRRLLLQLLLLRALLGRWLLLALLLRPRLLLQVALLQGIRLLVLRGLGRRLLLLLPLLRLLCCCCCCHCCCGRVFFVRGLDRRDDGCVHRLIVEANPR